MTILTVTDVDNEGKRSPEAVRKQRLSLESAAATMWNATSMKV